MKLHPQRALVLVYLSLLTLCAQGADRDAKPFAERHVILQVSDADQSKYTAVLDIANNLIKHYKGPDYIDLEVIAFGAGVHMLAGEVGENSIRIDSLIANGVRFYVCMNTLDSIQRKTGERPVVLPGVTGVQTGVAFMLEEIEAGYVHIQP
jgi:intracellular sulfur oxidation DsrE/DsrF family protein